MKETVRDIFMLRGRWFYCLVGIGLAAAIVWGLLK
jgi:hypothetical protein